MEGFQEAFIERTNLHTAQILLIGIMIPAQLLEIIAQYKIWKKLCVMWAQTDSQTAEQGVNVSISLGLSEGETPP